MICCIVENWKKKWRVKNIDMKFGKDEKLNIKNGERENFDEKLGENLY